jgi:hypothetical protein
VTGRHHFTFKRLAATLKAQTTAWFIAMLIMPKRSPVTKRIATAGLVEFVIARQSHGAGFTRVKTKIPLIIRREFSGKQECNILIASSQYASSFNYLKYLLRYCLPVNLNHHLISTRSIS